MVCPAPANERGYTRVDPAVLANTFSRLAANPGVLLAALGHAGTKPGHNGSRGRDHRQLRVIFADLVAEAAPEYAPAGVRRSSDHGSRARGT